jgi:hypothetical protein
MNREVKLLTLALVVVFTIVLVLSASTASATVKTVRVTTAQAKALSNGYTSTGNKALSSANSGITLGRRTGRVAKTTSGTKVTVTRSVGGFATLDNKTSGNDRDELITIDLQTGDVTFNIASANVTVCWPVVWGACGPCVSAGVGFNVTGGSCFNATVGPTIGAGIGCGVSCAANVAGTLDIFGGGRERLITNMCPNFMYYELVISGDVNITATVGCLVKFKLIGWNLFEKSVLLAQVAV